MSVWSTAMPGVAGCGDRFTAPHTRLGLLLRACLLTRRSTTGGGGGEGISAERHPAAITLGPRDGHQTNHRNRLRDCNFGVSCHGDIEYFAAGVIQREDLGAYIGIPVAVSTFGAPVSKFSRGSGARVTIKRVPDVSILKRIVLLVLS